MRKGLAAITLAVAVPLLSVTAAAGYALASDCKWHQDGSGSSCLILRDERRQKQIEMVLRSRRA